MQFDFYIFVIFFPEKQIHISEGKKNIMKLEL